MAKKNTDVVSGFASWLQNGGGERSSDARERTSQQKAAAEEEEKRKNAAPTLDVPPDVQEYLDEYTKMVASGKSEVDYYNDERQAAMRQAELSVQKIAEANGINLHSPQGQQWANMMMKYALDSSDSYNYANDMYNQAYTQQRAKDLENQTRMEQQKVKDFSTAMQQVDPVTGMPLSEMNMQSAFDDAKNKFGKQGFGHWDNWSDFANYG